MRYFFLILILPILTFSCVYKNNEKSLPIKKPLIKDNISFDTRSCVVLYDLGIKAGRLDGSIHLEIFDEKIIKKFSECWRIGYKYGFKTSRNKLVKLGE